MWKVVQANAGLVTEYELLQLLRQRGLRTPQEEAEAAERRAAAAADEPDAPADAADAPAAEPLYPQINAPFAVERAVFEYLSQRPAANQDPEKLAQFVALVTTNIELTRAEALQLASLRPRSTVELHAMVERCADRLSEEEVEQLLQICAEML